MSPRMAVFQIVALVAIVWSIAFFSNVTAAPCPGPCPPGTICKIEVVYAYMIHDPEAKKADNAWMGRGGFDLVHWTPQNKAWITTRRAEAETQKASMLGPRGQRSVIRKFFLMESNRPPVKRPRDDMSLRRL